MKEEQIPKHIAIIPDGNRRWAKERGLEGSRGHEEAVKKERILSLFDEARKLGVKYFSVWAFSTENWRRSEIEKKFLFRLIDNWIKGMKEYVHKNKIKFRHIGRKDRLPGFLIKTLEELERETDNYSDFYIQFCLDYGGRDEIVRAFGKAVSEGKKKLSEEEFGKYLDTLGIPEPDMIIRTGGEKRLSGFMSYQSTYSELYFTETYFPDFGPADLREAIKDFSRRKRRFGGD